MVQVQLLGGVTAVTDAGEPVDLGPAKCRAVLATLALSVGEAVPVSRLVDTVWGGDPPRTAEKTLQGYIVQLRKALGSATIVRIGEAYRLTLPPDRVDVARFRRLLRVGDIDAALATWRGPPLAGLEVPELAASASGLTEEWLRAVEEALGRAVDADPESAVAPLTELTGTYPSREGLWGLLMTALSRTGRQAEALAAFRRARDHLVEELGIEPGTRLRALEQRILAQEEGLQDARDDRARSPTPSATRPTGTVTFAFVEVTGADGSWGREGRETASTMGGLDALARTVSARHHGTVVVSTGGSFGVAFHRAEDAAAWATELHAAVAEEPWPGGGQVRLQVALHTGETDEHDGTYVGPPVHIASRLAAAAHGGQTVVSGVTAALLARPDLLDLGTHHLEGVAGRHEVRQLDDEHHPPLRTSTAQRGNLPHVSQPLFGRDPEFAVIADALEANRVVTLVGPGGIGKTTLALEAARRLQVADRRRVWFVELAAITDPADVANTIAETLGVTGGAGRTLTDSIVAAARARPTLLVLDNCEHVVDAAAALARAVADGGGSTRVLATSREGLAIHGERLMPLAPLDLDTAADLFAVRARTATGGSDLEPARATIERICHRLDGLPLAIELAAARTATLDPDQLEARLNDQLRLLTTSRRTVAEHHRTLDATIRWSYDLLTSPEQVLFERLAVFTGPFDLTAAEAVTAGGDLDTVAVDRHLDDLVTRSMVTIAPGPFGRRFRMLETLRQFAAARLGERGDTETIADRHAAWCRGEVASIGRLLQGHGEIEGVARLTELWPNLRAAVDRALATRDIDLADGLVRPVATEVTLRRQVEIADWAERILELLSPDDETRTVYWLMWACHRHVQAGDPDAHTALLLRYGHADHPLSRFNDTYLSGVGEAAHDAGSAAVAWLRHHGQDHAAALLQVSGVAGPLLALQRFTELETLAATMADHHQRHGPPTLRYFALGLQGYAAQYQGRPDDARRSFAEAAATALPAGTYRVTQTATARMVFEEGDRSRAYRLLRDNIDTLLDSDYTDVTRMVAIEFITIMAAIERLAEAAYVLPYLDTTGDFGAFARAHLVADAVRRIDADPTLGPDLGRGLDARATLTFMRDVLDELTPAN